MYSIFYVQSVTSKRYDDKIKPLFFFIVNIVSFNLKTKGKNEKANFRSFSHRRVCKPCIFRMVLDIKRRQTFKRTEFN